MSQVRLLPGVPIPNLIRVMALKQLRGEKVEFDETSYSPNDWNRLII
ncbi:hypothetical protein IJG27_00015 [Candidatus Saccharibacteria bacterium]|nr:hypothetical protein [Candidatus Saccharibacteria bacterium]